MAYSILVYVAGIMLAAIGALAGGFLVHQPYPGTISLVTFVFVGFLLEQSSTELKGGAKGSFVFVIYLSAAILFGAFWGGCVAALSTFASQVFRRNPAIKVVFNSAQQALTIAIATLL